MPCLVLSTLYALDNGTDHWINILEANLTELDQCGKIYIYGKMYEQPETNYKTAKA